MPLAAKDVQRAYLAIGSIRQHVLHPISEIVVVGQDHDAVRQFCRDCDVRYLCEDDVLPATVNEPRLTSDGQLRVRGWLRQQLLKLTAFDYIDAENILVYDADTYLVRDLSFFNGDRQILFLSDEYTKRYDHMIARILGPITRHPRSFVAHFMLLQRDVMKRLHRKALANCGMELIDTILSELDIASYQLSEFEIYGNYMHTFEPDRLVTRYWYNQKVATDRQFSLEELRSRYRHMNSVSAHEH
jgi:hypothetical protein